MHSLNGLRILNTRPLEQGEMLNTAIVQNGGIAIHLPTIVIEPKYINFVPKNIAQAIFISANAVHNYFTQHLPWDAAICTTAIGVATKNALEYYKISSVICPDSADSEHLLNLPQFQNVEQQNILLVKGQGGRELIAATLLKRGANVIALDVYTRQLPQIDPKFIARIWQDNAIDIIIFTSEQSIINLFQIVAPNPCDWVYNKKCLVISARLAKIAMQYGFNDVSISPPHEILTTLKECTHEFGTNT